MVHGAGEYAGAAAAQGCGLEARPFHRFPGDLQQQPLLGVHGDGLARADPEEVGVEQRGVVEESAVADVTLAGCAGFRVVQVVQVPAAVAGERADGVAAFGDELPQVFGGGDAAGVAAGHADDGDGFCRGARGGAQALVVPLQPLVLDERAAQRLDDLLDLGIHRRLSLRSQSWSARHSRRSCLEIRRAPR